MVFTFPDPVAPNTYAKKTSRGTFPLFLSNPPRGFVILSAVVVSVSWYPRYARYDKVVL